MTSYQPLKTFKLPTFEELPNIGLFSQQVVDYINHTLEPILFEGEALTATMIQNYVKLELIPAAHKRKYYARHIAYLISLTLLKQVIPTKNFQLGVSSMIERLSQTERQAYDNFVKVLSAHINHLGSAIESGMSADHYHFSAYDTAKELLALHLVSQAYVNILIAEKILNHDGLLKEILS